ncbi:MAG: arginine deiminase family protein [Polyangiaceae bacterium]
MRFTRAIVRTPSATYADGLTTAGLGAPEIALALAQHRAYVEALRSCGVEVTVLPPEDGYPDSTFVEDTAVLTSAWGIVARPGAPSRLGEADRMRPVLAERFADLGAIEAPGTLDGGDICEAGERFFIGLSHRTNEAGATQLADFLAARGRPSTIVDLRAVPGLLHLKSGIAAVAPDTMVVVSAFLRHPAFSEYNLIPVDAAEGYAANCVRVNDRVLVAEGYPRLEAALRGAGLSPLPLDMSEFRKMDGGLSCLSLRY